MAHTSETHGGSAAAVAADAEGAPAPALSLGGADFRTLLQSGTAWLERNAAAVDALNVFPVPDGDTGTNMRLTMQSSVEAAVKSKASGAGAVMKAAAQGAVMGARGNSGVILSQILAGIARGLGDHESCDASLLAASLGAGADMAYRAVSRPVEGTILTVARAAGEGALAAAGQPAAATPLTCLFILGRALAAAQQAVEHTPEQLPVLRQAGVVDAGGEGYRVILEGMVLALSGRPLPQSTSTTTHMGEGVRSDATTTTTTTGPGAVDAPVGEEWGYCTQFVINGQALDVLQLRHELQEIAESALVVGDESLVRVHGHTEDPGRLLSFATRFGRLQRVSIEDMDAQHDAWLRSQVETQLETQPETRAETASETPADVRPDAPVAPSLPLATVAVAPGPGLADVLRSLGVQEVVPGGQTMNPSANELIEAARRTGAETVILLPNNGNVVMTAQQAATLADTPAASAEGAPPPRLVVVPTRSVAQGIAAQLAFDVASSPEENAAAMSRAAGSVRTVEVTRATRTVTIDGIAVKEGDFLALLDDDVVSATARPLDAALEALDRAGAAKAEVVTVYRGQSPSEADSSGFVAGLRDRYPDAEIELVFGGQPHYDYLISVE